MSEPDDIFGFQEADDGLDIDAIFGSNVEAPSDPPPIPSEPQSSKTTDAPTQAAGTPDARPAAAPAEMKKESAAVTEVAAKTKPAAVTKTPTKEGTEPDLFAAFAETADETKPAPETGPVKAVSVAEQQTSLFDKPAIFKYGSAKDPITDASMTFEELRIQKAEDFPELEEGKKVSWTVKYGDITKSIPLPRETTIAKIKEEIEKSKPFLDALKKGKIKDPECLVTPKVVAGSKGVAAYKGVYPTVEAARRSDKLISLIPSSDGKIYEMRSTELGEFIAPKNKITDFSEVRAGFTPALPLIPRALMGQLISFFRSFMGKDGEFEALALVYWDRQEEDYVLRIPRQTISRAHIGFSLEDDHFSDDRYLHYADIHSHNSMAAKFSTIDDADERATRLYIVIGRLDRFYPEICARVSCGGAYLEIDPAEVVEGIGEEFPPEWLDQVELQWHPDDGATAEEYIPCRSKRVKVTLR